MSLIRVRYHFDSIKYFLNIEDLNLFVPTLDIRFRYRVSHKSDFTLFLLFSRVLEQVQRNF